MRLVLIRHGATKGNVEHRYVGSTDEELIEDEKIFLVKQRENWKNKEIDFSKIIIYSSPLLRCKETANILFPNQEIHVVNDFRECHFGVFEYKNYLELDGNVDYQRFIDTNGESGFPGGEDREHFQKRCVKAFQEIMKEITEWDQTLVFVVHGGTIMALCDYYSEPHRDYFNWQIENGNGFQIEIKNEEKKFDTRFHRERVYRFEDIRKL